MTAWNTAMLVLALVATVAFSLTWSFSRDRLRELE